MLAQKINVDFLQPIKSAIIVELSKLPVTMAYNQVLMIFRNEVNRKFPPTLTPLNSRARRGMRLSLGIPGKEVTKVVVAEQMGEEGAALEEAAGSVEAEVDVGSGAEDTLRQDG